MDAVAAAGSAEHRRLVIPAALVAAEYVVLSWLVDIPAAGPARALGGAVTILLPVAVGALAAGVLLGGGSARREGDAPLPPWRPFPALALQPLAFAALAAWALRLFGGASPPRGLELAVWVAAAGLVALLAVASAAPLPIVVRRALAGRAPTLLALAAGVFAWRIAVAAEALWGVLSGRMLIAAAWLLGAAGLEPGVVPEEALLGVGDFWVEVAPVCSGADGLGLVAVFQGLWLAVARDRLRLPRALVVLPLGAAAALAANVVRLAGLVALGGMGYEDLAAGGFHSRTGWLLFLAIALGTVAAAERWRWLRKEGSDATRRAPPLPDDAAAHVGPLVASIAAALVSGLFATGVLDRLYALRIVAALAVLAAVRPLLPRPSISVRPFAVLAGAGVAAAWILAPAGDAAGLDDALRALAPSERALWLAVRVAGSVLVIPLVEELAFRGFLLPWLAARRDAAPDGFPWIAVLVSSAAFGSLHGSFLLGAGSGLVFALVRLRRGRLGDAVVAHVVANAGIALAVLASGRWDLWG